MRRLRVHRQLTTWIALLAVLLASLAPAVSHALSAERGTAWVQVCTTEGAKWVSSHSDDSGNVPASTHVLEHCPYCSTHAPVLGLPPRPEAISLPAGFKDDFPPAFLAAPRTLHAWLSAQPRAPPLSS